MEIDWFVHTTGPQSQPKKKGDEHGKKKIPATVRNIARYPFFMSARDAWKEGLMVFIPVQCTRYVCSATAVPPEILPATILSRKLAPPLPIKRRCLSSTSAVKVLLALSPRQSRKSFFCFCGKYISSGARHASMDDMMVHEYRVVATT